MECLLCQNYQKLGKDLQSTCTMTGAMIRKDIVLVIGSAFDTLVETQTMLNISAAKLNRTHSWVG